MKNKNKTRIYLDSSPEVKPFLFRIFMSFGFLNFYIGPLDSGSDE